jgi:hypothetical protein
MRFALAAILVLIASPALAQFPPPGIYTCSDAHGAALGTLSLLTAGDYQWDTPDGKSATGQMASAATSLRALSGPLGEAHWSGDFVTNAGATTFAFQTDAGAVSCK